MALVTMKACECEHIAHFEHDRRTPNGNPGHRYGAAYFPSYVEPVKTCMGTFHVCKDCAQDCYGPDSVARKG